MNSRLIAEKPIIYADMNIYRYLACGDISIVEPDRFIWAYSIVHLNEVHRNGNTDALEGMKLLQAVEIRDVLNEDFQSVGNITLFSYVDPYLRYQCHLQAIAGYEDLNDHVVEHLIRFFGADNFEELSETPRHMQYDIQHMTHNIDDERRQSIAARASSVAEEMRAVIDKHLKERIPIEKTRTALGVTSEIRKTLEASDLVIDDVWELLSPQILVSGRTKDQFFGFSPTPEMEGIQHTQYGAISSAHIVLNMLGISPDKGLAKRDKIKSILSDGQHTGMASYCNAFISADRAVINKARGIYTYLKNVTNALHFNYEKGYELKLGIEPVSD